MGCSPSSLPIVDLNNSGIHQKKKNKSPCLINQNNDDNSSTTIGEIESLLNEDTEQASPDQDVICSQGNEVKAIAYDISLDGENRITTDKECILKKSLPNRLRHLEPLQNPPLLTRDKLTKKLKSAEEKRKQILEIKRYSHHKPKTLVTEKPDQILTKDAQPKNWKNTSLYNRQINNENNLKKKEIKTTNSTANKSVGFQRSSSFTDDDSTILPESQS